MTLRLKNRFLISSIAFIMLLLALLVLLDVPAMREIRLIANQVDEERVRLEKLYIRGQLQKNVQNNLKKIQDRIGFLDELMLQENQELQYITTLEQLATEENVALAINIGTADRVPEQLFSTLAFSFELNGRWENMLKWIARVEGLHYYTNIEAITVAIREDEDGKALRPGKMSIAAKTFWLIPSL